MTGAPSRTSRVSQTIKQHTQRPSSRPGPTVSPLHVGDPDFATPEFITDALCAAVRSGLTHYAQPQGDPLLREALAADLSSRARRPYSDRQVIVTAGGSPAINSAILAVVDPGDRVLIPNPTYSLYADSTRLAGGVPEYLPPGRDGRIDLELLERRAPGARLVVLCQPGNPTGGVYTRGELEQIARTSAEHGLLVLSDEAYDHIVYHHATFVSALEIDALADRLIYCQTLSKTFAMTGWRIGYVAAPPDVAAAAGLIHRTYNGAVNSAVQRAALAAVTTPSTWPADRLADYERRRKIAVDALVDLPGVSFEEPDGAFYVFLRYPHALSSRQMAGHALAHGVGVRSGSEFGPAGEGFVRIAFCVEDAQLTTGLARLRTALTTDSPQELTP
ncbi:pyridoxal phosphate-dependent aminotransferase [Nonomuraea sp. B5E05]|uniref:pyridoxal phosphate-dependent aminotransferase n=1 Tax=Nonomuraea sp. B5E05 TaxID=3153569 RepID=UPI0032610E82